MMQPALSIANCAARKAMMALFLTRQNMGVGQKANFGASKMI
jgi:hypothetical protein